LFWFDEVPGKALYQGKFNAPMLWNSNFFMTLESMKILRLLTDVWLPDFKFGSQPMRDGVSENALVLGDSDQEPRTHPRMGRGLFDPPLGDAQSCRVLYVSSLGMDCRAYACSAD
jgi:hypothetical protein